MTETGYLCELCRLPIEAEPFVLFTSQGKLRFCCEGCQGIYRMLHEDELVDAPPEPEAGR